MALTCHGDAREKRVLGRVGYLALMRPRMRERCSKRDDCTSNLYDQPIDPMLRRQEILDGR